MPEIPSAEEMEKEGVDLAKLNIQLLQKIEELTLYTLQQERKIQDQQEQLEAMSNLKSEVKQLKEQMQYFLNQ